MPLYRRESEEHIKRLGVIDLLLIFAYEGNEYRLIATTKNRIGYSTKGNSAIGNLLFYQVHSRPNR